MTRNVHTTASVGSKRKHTKISSDKHVAKTEAAKSVGNTSDGLSPSTVKGSLNYSKVARLLSLAKSERFAIAGGIGCLVISSAVTMSVPYGLGRILDIIYSTSAGPEIVMEKLNRFCLMLAGVFLLGGLANAGRVYFFSNASLRITRDIRSQVYNSMLNQEVGWFDQKGTGELINRLSSDTYLVGNSLSMNLSDGLRSTVMVLVGTSMMVYTSPQLALVGMCVVPCVAGMAVVYGRYLRSITKELMDKYASVMKIGEERLGNVKTVKMFCKETFEKELFANRLAEALQIGYRETKAKSIFYGMTGFSGNVIILSVLYYGGTMVSNSEMTIGALTSFILYAGYTAISIGGLSNFYTELNKGIGSAATLWDIIDRNSRSVESSSLEYEKRISALSDNLRQVRFKNNEASNAPDVLKQLKEQNLLLLRICSDLSDELLQIQQKREDIRIKIELQEQNLGTGVPTAAGVPVSNIVGPSSHLT